MIGVIGCGNMAQAIVKGCHKKNPKLQFLTFNPTHEKSEELAQAVGGRALKDLAEVSAVDSIMIACKPQHLNKLSEDLKKSGVSLEDKYVISILAATPIETLKDKLGAKRITRVMPNTPAFVGKGMSLLIHSKEVKNEDKELVSKVFKACGKIADMPNETIFDQVTTVSGSGPAYVFLFAQTMAEKLVSWGLEADLAKEIAIQLFCGSSELMSEQSNESLQELIDKVTSKGGVTIEAVRSYQKNNLKDLTSTALDAAFARSEEMRKEFN